MIVSPAANSSAGLTSPRVQKVRPWLPTLGAGLLFAHEKPVWFALLAL